MVTAGAGEWRILKGSSVAPPGGTAEDGEYLDPIRSQYRETIILLSASYEGSPVGSCPFIWVDQDVSLMRGLVQGWPSKLARLGLPGLTICRRRPASPWRREASLPRRWRLGTAAWRRPGLPCARRRRSCPRRVLPGRSTRAIFHSCQPANTICRRFTNWFNSSPATFISPRFGREMPRCISSITPMSNCPVCARLRFWRVIGFRSL